MMTGNSLRTKARVFVTAAVATFVVLAFSLLFLFSLPAFAGRKDAPRGSEIAKKAKAARLDTAGAVTGEEGGKRITFTPAIPPAKVSAAELEEGQVIGVLETETAGTKLPPGKYNIFAAKVGNQWRAYAEAGSKIIAEADRVTLESATPGRKKVEFRARSPWGFCILQWEGFNLLCFWF